MPQLVSVDSIAEIVKMSKPTVEPIRNVAKPVASERLLQSSIARLRNPFSSPGNLHRSMTRSIIGM